MLKIFPYPISSETQKRVHLRKVSVLWAKTISTDNLVTPTAPLHRNFDKRVFLKHRTFRLQSFLLTWDKKFPKETRGIPLLCINFFDTRTFLSNRRAPLRVFAVPWNKIISTENGVTCSLLLSPTFFDTRKWRNTRGLPCKSFRHCETKSLRRRYVMLPQSPTTPSYPWTFSIAKIFFKHRTVPLRNVSVVSIQQFWLRIVMPAPFVFLTFFDIKTYSKQRKVPLRNISVLWNKEFGHTSVITATFLIPNTFPYQKFHETQKGSSTKIFCYGEIKYFHGKIVTSPSYA